ncbi:hypothetical protein PC116_g11104 [Phytophthora cactorum]|uniref:Uncharacterized protein n=1 Tax=Phytophthora cactorum TaxID=29920 RepID=A0A8T1FXH3_9STRA|nr:hypothetical protein PC114_g14687 [Phytophthora cactorum]KAG2984270.1 hypothetical protein PC118_g8959 [Phytophthora cactorum]KAG3001599.1 hypothetical protein PC119_g16666 [Phytophthora cactorum]KAG3147792.1 hypothetical protein C6341_g17621 [Phytophthora cactorum]KAG4240936.1 hypothetical protein PC116_g11104 [Phytophthora cactorum]
MGDHAAFVGRGGGGAGLPTITCKRPRCPVDGGGKCSRCGCDCDGVSVAVKHGLFAHSRSWSSSWSTSRQVIGRWMGKGQDLANCVVAVGTLGDEERLPQHEWHSMELNTKSYLVTAFS